MDVSFDGWPAASVVNGGRSIRSRRVGTDVKVPPAVALNLGVQGHTKSLAPARPRNKAPPLSAGWHPQSRLASSQTSTGPTGPTTQEG